MHRMRMPFPLLDVDLLYVLFVSVCELFSIFSTFSNSDYSIFNRAVPIRVCSAAPLLG